MRARIDQRGKGVEISVLELRELAVLHQQRGQRVSFVGELLENGRVGARAGGRLLPGRKPEFSEENRA